MTHYATVHCNGLPEVAVFRDGQTDYEPPVRIHADADRGLLALQSDVPVSPNLAEEFVGCLTGPDRTTSARSGWSSSPAGTSPTPRRRGSS